MVKGTQAGILREMEFKADQYWAKFGQFKKEEHSRNHHFSKISTFQEKNS